MESPCRKIDIDILIDIWNMNSHDSIHIMVDIYYGEH